MIIQLHVGTKTDLSFNFNLSNGRDYREKRIVISRFLALYIPKEGRLLGELQNFGPDTVLGSLSGRPL